MESNELNVKTKCLLIIDTIKQTRLVTLSKFADVVSEVNDVNYSQARLTQITKGERKGDILKSDLIKFRKALAESPVLEELAKVLESKEMKIFKHKSSFESHASLNKGIVFISHYFSAKSAEPSAEVIEIFFNTGKAYFYSTKKFYSGGFERSPFSKAITIHFTNWQKKDKPFEGKPDMDVYLNIFDNGKLDPTYKIPNEHDQDRFFPSSFTGHVKTGYYRIYGGMMEVYGQPINESTEDKIVTYSKIADKKMLELSPNISKMIYDRRFDVNGAGQMRTPTAFPNSINHKLYLELVGVYEVFTLSNEQNKTLLKWVIEFRKDLISHGKSYDGIEYKGVVDVRDRKIIYLKLNSAKNWYERASYSTRDKGEITLEDRNERHYFLSFATKAGIIKGTFNALEDYHIKQGKCIFIKKAPPYSHKINSEHYNDMKADIYDSEQEINQLFASNPTLKEFFKDDF